MSVSVPTPPAWAAHEASRGLGPSAPPRSLCPRQPVLNHFPPLILLRAEDGPGKRGWLLDAQARGYQDGKWHTSSTLRVHFPHLPLRKKLFLNWVLVLKLPFRLSLAGDHWLLGVWDKVPDRSRLCSSRLSGEQGDQVELPPLPTAAQTIPSTSLPRETDCTCICPISRLWKVTVRSKTEMARVNISKPHLLISSLFLHWLISSFCFCFHVSLLTYFWFIL